MRCQLRTCGLWQRRAHAPILPKTIGRAQTMTSLLILRPLPRGTAVRPVGAGGRHTALYAVAFAAAAVGVIAGQACARGADLSGMEQSLVSLLPFMAALMAVAAIAMLALTQWRLTRPAGGGVASCTALPWPWRLSRRPDLVAAERRPRRRPVPRRPRDVHDHGLARRRRGTEIPRLTLFHRRNLVSDRRQFFRFDPCYRDIAIQRNARKAVDLLRHHHTSHWS